jgi:hypothetical protein
MNFDHSYTFERGTQWVRTPNIFNLSNEILNRVEASKKGRYIHKNKGVGYESAEIIQSDILQRSDSSESNKIMRTVTIEVGGKYYDR